MEKKTRNNILCGVFWGIIAAGIVTMIVLAIVLPRIDRRQWWEIDPENTVIEIFDEAAVSDPIRISLYDARHNNYPRSMKVTYGGGTFYDWRMPSFRVLINGEEVWREEHVPHTKTRRQGYVYCEHLRLYREEGYVNLDNEGVSACGYYSAEYSLYGDKNGTKVVLNFFVGIEM